MPDGSRKQPVCACPSSCTCLRRHVCRLQAVPGSTVTPRAFARGAPIASAGAAGLRLHVVATGMVAAAAVMADGRRQLMCFHVPGDIICPFSVADADCWAEALTETTTWEVELCCEPGAMRTNPDLCALLFDLAHADLARSLAHVVMLGRLDGTERLAAFLADMAQRTGRRRNGCWHVTLPMSREDIADYLGLNAETVSRIISRIKKTGLARFSSPTECEIPDLDLLNAQAPVNAPLPRALSITGGTELIA
ncbi:MAG: helix-turn-helix domain-containing protein [Pseudomonadota bacterium]